MRISQLLDKHSIIADLQAGDKKGVIDELAAAAASATSANQQQSLSGTKVSTDETTPVAVFAGHECALIPTTS